MVTLADTALRSHRGRVVLNQGEGDIDYCVLVDRALFADCYTLDGFPVLSELPLVARWGEAHPRDLLPRGKALHALLRRAVADVAACAPRAIPISRGSPTSPGCATKNG